MILRMSSFSSVTKIVGMIPSVVPESGSTAISGTGMKGASCGSIQRVIAWYHFFLGLAEFFLGFSGPCGAPCCCAPSFSVGTPGGAVGPGWPGAGGGAAGVTGDPGTTCASNSGAEGAGAAHAEDATSAVHTVHKAPALHRALEPVAKCLRSRFAAGVTRPTARSIEAGGRYPPKTHRPWWKCEIGLMSGGSGPRKSQIPRPSMHRAAWCRSSMAATGKRATPPTTLVRESPLRCRARQGLIELARRAPRSGGGGLIGRLHRRILVRLRPAHSTHERQA